MLCAVQDTSLFNFIVFSQTYIFWKEVEKGEVAKGRHSNTFSVKSRDYMKSKQMNDKPDIRWLFVVLIMMYTRQNASSWQRRPRRGWLTSGTKWFSCKCSLRILPLLTSKLRAHLVSSMLQAQHLSWSKKSIMLRIISLFSACSTGDIKDTLSVLTRFDQVSWLLGVRVRLWHVGTQQKGWQRRKKGGRVKKGGRA